MEALFCTTVKRLVDATQIRLNELQSQREENRARTFEEAKACTSYDELRAVMDRHNERGIDDKIRQYTENLEYLTECEQDMKVALNQTEWRHYFHAAQRPELC